MEMREFERERELWMRDCERDRSKCRNEREADDICREEMWKLKRQIENERVKKMKKNEKKKKWLVTVGKFRRGGNASSG